MVTAALVLAFCLMFVLAAGAITTTWLGILEMRKLGTSAFQHLKANNIQEVTKAEIETKRADVDLEQLKDAWQKEMAETEKIPVKKPRMVKDINGRSFNMDDLEAL